MSSRALRKLQREQEERRLAELDQHRQDADEGEDSDDDAHVKANTRQKSAFELLNEVEEDEAEAPDSQADDKPAEDDGASEDLDGENRSTQKPKKKSKKKKKKKGKGTPSTAQQGKSSQTSTAADGPDEIDRALESLRLKEGASNPTSTREGIAPELQRFYSLLSTDSKHLNALNEMKKLFGSAVLDGEPTQNSRRRGQGPQNLDLGAALAARHNPVSRGQGLAGLALRRNVFVQGKEEWPKATTGGLGMELVEQAFDHTTEYKFVHGHGYRSTQREFEQVVETMDPQRMIVMLQYHPYHISTLLQVSEIAKQQGDHAVAADLLERASFSFGRSVHSSFATALAEGKARLDFRRPENREFWVAAWRYIGTLGQKGTWRTAYEWSKLLLSLDPEGDPYRQRLVIDQLAIRGGQFESFVGLAETDPQVMDWGQSLPHIQISLALAHMKLKHPVESRKILSEAVSKYPWLFPRLFKELDIERIPKAIWGATPRTPMEELQAASYATRAKDLWNTPESISLLVEVVEVCEPASPAPADTTAIDLNDARHIIASDIPSLISLLPRAFTTAQTSASDPLPPEDNLPSYSTTTQLEADEEEDDDEADSLYSDGGETTLMPENAGPNGLRAWASRMMSRFGIVGMPGGALTDSEDTGHDHGAELADGPEDDMPQPAQRPPRRAANERSEAQLLREEDEMLMRAIAASQRDMQAMQAAAEAEAEAPAETEAAAATEAEAATNAGAGAEARAQAEHQSPTSHTAPAPRPAPSSSEPIDPQAEQRYLAGRGLQALKEFATAHGTDEAMWGFGLQDDRAAPLAEYVRRAGALPRAQRRFILDFALPQGAGRETGELVRRLVGG